MHSIKFQCQKRNYRRISNNSYKIKFWLYELIRGRKLLNILKKNGGCTNKQGICTKLIKRITHAIDKAPQVAAIVHSNNWQVALASIYVFISVRGASCKFLRCYIHVAQFSFVPDVRRTLTSEPSKSEKQTIVANSTAFA